MVGADDPWLVFSEVRVVQGGGDEGLPSFEQPPVAEVALTVYFLPALDLDVSHMGLLRESVRDRLPGFQQHPTLPPQQPESLGQPASGLAMHFTFGPSSATPRCWFYSADEQWLMQVQADRLVINWRKSPQGPRYPRYPAVRDVFEREATALWSFLERQGVPLPSRFMGEITYVNTIQAGTTWQTHAEMGSVFNVTLGDPVPGVVMEDGRWNGRYVFLNRTNEPTGRLYTYIEPVITFPEAKAAYNFNLVARGGESPNLADVLDLLDSGREVIVKTFEAMTTTQMHDEWRRSDGR